MNIVYCKIMMRKIKSNNLNFFKLLNNETLNALGEQSLKSF